MLDHCARALVTRRVVVLLCVLLSACSGTRQVITNPMAASTDSVGAQVVHELWEYYAALATVAQSQRGNREVQATPCSPLSLRGPLPKAEACIAYAYSLTEDSVYPAQVLRYTDSLAARLVRMRTRVGAHRVLDEALIFAHAWRRSPDALAVPHTGCDAVPWWCDAVRGMVHHRLGATVESEQHYARMLAAMPEKEACGWRMLGLLPRATCADASPARDTLMWWLSDPLWLELGNDRYTEHLSRHVLFRIFEHHEDELRRAGKAPKRAKSGAEWGETLGLSRTIRYGTYNVPLSLDIDRARLLRTFGSVATLRDVQGPRYEFTPLDPHRFSEVLATDTSQLAAWPAPVSGWGGSVACTYGDCLTRPGAGLQQSQRMLTSRGRIRMIRQEGVGVNESWGRHQRFDRVREFQVVTLPRDSSRALYAAYPVADVSQPGPMGAAFSRSPTDSTTRLLASDRRGDVVRVRGTLPNDGGVLSLEAVANPRQVFRHRYYLPADTAHDVSPVVLLADQTSNATAERGAALPSTLPLERMLPRTWLHPTERVVLYWEVSDSAFANTVALEFRRADKSAWQQVTGIFRRGADGQSVRVEPGAMAPMVRDGQRVGFGLPFTLSGLAPGRYEVRAIARETATGAERAGKATEIELRLER